VQSAAAIIAAEHPATNQDRNRAPRVERLDENVDGCMAVPLQKESVSPNSATLTHGAAQRISPDRMTFRESPAQHRLDVVEPGTLLLR
jgi:hypothetical protein